MKTSGSRPSLSVVVVVYNIPREAPRTLHSLSAAYQQHLHPDDYEVVVVDNGSTPAVDAGMLSDLSGNFRLIRIDAASPSPAAAVNRGLAEARGEIVGVMIDGARIATPGLLRFALHGARFADRAIVAALGWYVGHDHQSWAIDGGYNREREDALLEGIEWPNDGYRLFEIGTMDESSTDGWFQPMSESNALFMRRELWRELGGADERFGLPGGGLLNLDTFRRAMELPESQLVILLGEATFHQIHGGTSTNAPADQQGALYAGWAQQYLGLRGRPYEVPKPTRPPIYVGTLSREALARMTRAAQSPALPWFETPLGADFDHALWTRPQARSADPVAAALLDLAQNEFRAGRFEASCAVARLLRKRAPDDPGPRRLLQLLAPRLSAGGPPEPQRVEVHFALATAHRVLGETEAAVEHFRAALRLNPDLPMAHWALSQMRLPGDDYLVWVARLYKWLAPEAVLEIGVYEGASLCLVQPPAIAIGVDPTPRLIHVLKAETHIFTETSDAFFEKARLPALLAGRRLSLTFIDGLHLFEQGLKDFINAEACSSRDSVIMLHDTVPLDEATQSRARDTQFHTGDIWKVIVCLKHYRPDLRIFTIATPPSGLTIVIGLDPASSVLADRYDEACARFMDLPFSTIEHRREDALNIVGADWAAIQKLFEERSRFNVSGVDPR